MSMIVKVVILRIENGNGPFNLLFFKLRTVRMFDELNKFGMVPLKKLSPNIRVLRLTIVEIFGGIDP
jgi:hypothetical protein